MKVFATLSKDCRVEGEDYKAGEKVKMSKATLKHLTATGYIKTDDTKAVKK